MFAWQRGAAGRLRVALRPAAAGRVATAASPPATAAAAGVQQQQRRTITINGRYYDPFHPLHIMGMLTLMLAGGCVKMIIERRERVAARNDYERQLAAAVAAERRAEADAEAKPSRGGA
jgi:hypothetical protein